MSDNHFNSTLNEFDNLFVPLEQSAESSNDIYSSSAFDVENNQIFSSFISEKQNIQNDAPTVNRVREEICYNDINQIYESISEIDNKKVRKPKKKRHTIRNLFIIILLAGLIGGGVWVYRNHYDTVINLFYLVKEYVLYFISFVKDKIQQL